jgi:hypothetical protein
MAGQGALVLLQKMGICFIAKEVVYDGMQLLGWVPLARKNVTESEMRGAVGDNRYFGYPLAAASPWTKSIEKTTDAAMPFIRGVVIRFFMIRSFRFPSCRRPPHTWGGRYRRLFP